MDQKMADDSVMELRELNSLIYLRPDNASLMNQRTMKSYNFSNSQYQPGQTAQAILNCGNDALWGPTCYLRVEFTKAADTDFGKGSILNYIRNVRLTHRSGEVLEYVQSSNVLAQILRRYTVSVEDREKVDGQIEVSVDATTSVVRTIPLWMLLGVFNDQSQYIPPAFLAGAKLEIDLESKEIAQSAGTAISDIKLEVVLDSSQVYDSVQKQLLDEQADVDKSGLQYSYSTWFSTSNQFSSDSVNFDIQQSASVTEKVVAVVRETADIADGKDSFDFDNVLSKWQFRLSSQYMPQRPITNNVAAASSTTESYNQALTAFSAQPHQFHGFHGGQGVNATFGEFGAGLAVYAQSLEKSASGLQLTGEPTNNSRILNLEATKAARADTVNVFLQYLRVANVLGDNLIVDR